ncbi:MAG: hypothetical protein IKG42_04575 [Clostridia bacterium]|nr:hypothetical protein [Clostridia bacterium]
MKIDYKNKHIISYSDVDFNINFGIFQVANMVQDIGTTFFKLFKCDNPTVRKRNNAAWVISKTKIVFNRIPKLGDEINSRVYFTDVRPVRTLCETDIKNHQGDCDVVVKQEYCTIDIDTRKVRKLSTVGFPEDMEIEEGLIDNSFKRLKRDFTQDDLIYETRAYVTDLDYNEHVNNAIYIRYILNCFNLEFLKKNVVKEFEIHYISEVREGEYLSVFMDGKDNEFEFLIMCDDREVVRAWIKF